MQISHDDCKVLINAIDCRMLFLQRNFESIALLGGSNKNELKAIQTEINSLASLKKQLL